MRKVRKIVTYVCTACFRLFSNSKEAKAHAAAHPAPRGPRTGRSSYGSQTRAVLDAVRAGATTGIAISKKTKLPIERVHSVLSYHRRRGNITGFSGSLRAK